MRKYLIISFLLATLGLKAQESESESKGFNIGLGMGMDYGGIGFRGTYLPIERLGLYAGVGYNLNAAGFNAGAQFLFPKRRNAFYLTAMYGYNAVLIVSGDIADKGTYYGVTAGAGYQLRVGPKGNFFNFELLVPFRNSNFYDDLDALEYLGADPVKPLPVAFSFGFHFKMHK